MVDRAYQNYDTLNDDDKVTFQVYNPNRTIVATTTIKALDDARNAGNASTLVVTFAEK